MNSNRLNSSIFDDEAIYDIDVSGKTEMLIPLNSNICLSILQETKSDNDLLLSIVCREHF